MTRFLALILFAFPFSAGFAFPGQLGKSALEYLGGFRLPGDSTLFGSPKTNSNSGYRFLSQAGNLPSSGLTRSEKAEGETEEEEEIPAFFDNRKPEIGFWVGASNPLPGTESQKILDTTLGAGIFFRIPWPWIFYLEFGTYYANFLSRSERALTTVPVYTALCYKLPFDLPISFIVKLGGGETYVVARPANTARWDHTLYGGFEASFIAGKKIRIGIRVDYNKIYESNLSLPPETKYPYRGPGEDPRLSNPNYYRKVDTEFFHFGLMVSVFI
ncbi:hypothetical protein CH373_04530 [Leptospira perolatii]|uniref:Outer membrane protein beta-barrel domain-containing protein n=1 Tax=Leptospira perolatii TaxID=2023191 RepID=A0A2M9ZQ38_9LEPT|nr:hypothetical protein [Leptospira perolatii]PJZ68261.1 hypothetical protein CH360_17255 [Leptospira perolatii]PJZ74186.1 hypothetical protein CH373_04530 [Leptospira perolatii]